MPAEIVALLDGATDAAVVLDSERRIVYYNRAYQVASGRRGRELSQAAADGQHCWEVFPLAVCQTACVGCQARDAKRAIRVEMVDAVRGDGEELTLAVTAAPLAGGLIFESYRDITADVRIQRKYNVLLERERRAKQHLEEEVRVRTTELQAAGEELQRTHAQLIHQEKMSSLGRLVAGVAHELNNPINFIYGNVDFLGRYLEGVLGLIAIYEEGRAHLPADLAARVAAKEHEIELDFLIDDSRKLMRSIRAGAERTANIVRDLTAFSRTSTGRMQETDLVAGIETTLNLIGPLLKNRIKVRCDFPEPHPHIVCHAGHVNQVFMNILTNAAQAIPDTGTIDVEIRRLANDEGVEVSIRDSGRGIAPENLAKIFDPFFTTKGVGEGTGLGLAISHSIVRAHGGRIFAESEPGHGARFVVILPIIPAAAEPSEGDDTLQ